MKIGIMTGGGDCPGLNATIRGVIRSMAHIDGGSVIGFKYGFKGLVENNYILLDSSFDNGLIQRGGTILGTTNRDNPFQFLATVDGKETFIDRSDDVLENYKRHNLDALIVIGGDGTLGIALKLQEKGLNIIGIPKTIDNDLSATDYTFGFDTAINIVTEAVDRLKTTAESHDRVMVVEVMGRDTGWIALYSGIAGGVHIILIPEIPYNLDVVCHAIKARCDRGRPSTIVMVAEGAKPIGGDVTIKQLVNDPQNMVRLGGIGYVLGSQIEKETGVETRVVQLGHIQRGGTPSAFDRVLCTRLGVEAVNMATRKEFGMMACLKTPNIKAVPMAEAAVNRKVEQNNQLIATARSIHVCLGD